MRTVQIVVAVFLAVILNVQPALSAKPNWRWFAPGSGSASALALNANGTVLAACDGSSVKFWDLASANFLRTIDIDCSSVAISPVDSTITAVGSYQKITLINSITGAELSTITDLEYGVHSLAYSSNGLFLAAGGGYTPTGYYNSRGELKVFRMTDNAVILNKTYDNAGMDEVNSVAFTFNPADGLNPVIAAAGYAGLVWLYKLDGTPLQSEIFTGAAEMFSVAFSDNAEYLVLGGGSNFYSDTPSSTLLLYKRNSITGQYEAYREFSGHTDAVKAVGFYAGFVVSGGQDEKVRFWSILGPDDLSYEFPIHTGYPNSDNLPTGVAALAVNPTGPLVTAGDAGDGSIWYWNLGIPGPSIKLNYHSTAIEKILFRNYLGAETLYSIGYDRAIYKWPVDSDLQNQTNDPAFTIAADAYFADLSKANEHLLIRRYAAVNNLEVWSLNGLRLVNLGGCNDYIDQAAFSPDGTMVAAACRDGRIYYWKLFVDNNSQPHYWSDAGSERIRHLAFAPDGLKLMTADVTDVIKLWKTANGKLIRSYTDLEGGSEETLQGLGFDPSGTRFGAYGEDGESLQYGIKIWSTGKAAPVQTFINWWLSSPVFTPDTNSICTASSSAIQFYGINNGEDQSYLAGLGGYLNTYTLSPDNQVAAAAYDDQTLYLRRIADGAQLESYDREVGYVQHLVYSETGSHLAVARQDGSIGVLTNNIPTQHRYVVVASYGPDQGVLIKAPEDTTGASSGRTPFGRSYLGNPGQAFTAPLQVNGKYFQYWLWNGVQRRSISNKVVPAPGPNQLLTAVYSADGRGIPPLAAPTPPPGVQPPVISRLINSGTPLAITVTGRNFKPRVKVFINHQRWLNFRRISPRQLVIDGGSSLSGALSTRKPALIRLRNPDGGEAFKVWR